MRKVCDELGLRFRMVGRAVLKKKDMNKPKSAQLKKDLDKIEEEHHVILIYTKPTDLSIEG